MKHHLAINLNLQNSSSTGQEKNYTSPEKLSLNQSIENIEGTDKRKESIDIKTSKINNNEFNEIKDKDISLNKENKKDSKVKIYDAKEIVNNKNEISFGGSVNFNWAIHPSANLALFFWFGVLTAHF